MAQIKTITASTTEQAIDFGVQYQFVWFRNLGETDCYVSDHSGIVADADGVAILKAGENVRLTPSGDTVYIKAASDTASVEVHAQNYSDCPFKVKAKGGEQITIESLRVIDNGTYTAPSGTAYSPVVVDNPNTFTLADEGKVIKDQKPTAQTARTVTENGTYDTTMNNSVVVNVDEAPVLPNTYDRLDYVIANGAAFRLTYAENKGDLFEIVTSANALDSGYHTFFSVYNAYSLTYNGSTLTSWQIDTFSGDVSVVVDTVYRTIIEIDRSHGDRVLGIGGYPASEWAEFFDGRIYSIKCKRTDEDGTKSMFNNSNYAVYFIPARRKSDNKVGLYEAVSGTFCPSETSTDFEAPTGA